MQNNHLSSKSSSIKQEIKRGPAIHYMPYLHQHTGMGWQSRLTALLAAATLTLSIWLPALAANQIDIVGPPGSDSFGSSITVLPNGNFVVTDPNYDIPGGATDVGAVYLYEGATHVLISTLTGSTSGDRVGSKGITMLLNGNYVVRSPFWDNDNAIDAGAVTWGSKSTGVSSVVSSNNSLVGSTSYDYVGKDFIYIGDSSVTVLSNGNYVVRSPDWDNGNATNAGAVTWGDGNLGISGIIDSNNSLVGSTSYDFVGSSGVTVLKNSSYVVSSPDWDNGSATNAGAVTWGNGSTGISGEVSISNSLVGSTSDDTVGLAALGHSGITPLSSGNYVVSSPEWDNGNVIDAGAVTWGNGSTGISGMVSNSNSLIGSTKGDQVGFFVVTALSNGNYVVSSPDWDNNNVIDAGAVTWGNGSTGVSGEVNSSNSLVGSTSGDKVGLGRIDLSSVTALSNGNYAVCSSYWDNGNVIDAGAVSWGNGRSGVSGVVSSSNSLVGSMNNDQVGNGGVSVLSNGNYVISSNYWDNGDIKDAGAATWSNGTLGASGVVSSSNSLVGGTSFDYVGSVTALSNGNYVASSVYWDNGDIKNAGAATWVNGTLGASGVVSSSNSIVGGTSDAYVGNVTALSNGNYVVSGRYWTNGNAIGAGAVTWVNGTMAINGEVSSENSLVGSTTADYVNEVAALSNGNYVVSSPSWDNGSIIDTGAVIWGSGVSGISGEVNSSNSLVGSTSFDYVGSVTVLSNGNYVVSSPHWNNDNIIDAGAVTWGSGSTGVSGILTPSNSVLGTAANGGSSMNFSYNATYSQLLVGRPAENIVTLFDVSEQPIGNVRVYLPTISR